MFPLTDIEHIIAWFESPSFTGLADVFGHVKNIFSWLESMGKPTVMLSMQNKPSFDEGLKQLKAHCEAHKDTHGAPSQAQAQALPPILIPIVSELLSKAAELATQWLKKWFS